MNHDINKDGQAMSGNEARGGRRRRKATTIGIAGVAALCATAAALVPAGGKIQAQHSTNEEGMVCEWGDIVGNQRVFNITATDGYTSEPDGNAIYDWSYTANNGAFQLPGPVLCANSGDQLVVNLHNNLPVNTSIQFPGQTGVTYIDGTGSHPVGPVAVANGPSYDLSSLVQDAAPNGDVTYGLTVTNEGTYVYESGTDPQLQVQMGLFGALVVYPTACGDVACTTRIPMPISLADVQAIPVDGGGTNGSRGLNSAAVIAGAKCAYRSVDDPNKCDPNAIFAGDKENILMLSEVDPGVHSFMEQAKQTGDATIMNWNSYPVGYTAHYFMINGRSMPDTIAPNFAPWLPAQPYGSMATVQPWSASTNPLDAFLRYVGIGTAGYDFHPHSNHERVIAEDGALMKTSALHTADSLTHDNTEEKFNILVGAGSTLDATFRWTNEEDYSNSDGHRVPVQWPQGPNMLEGDFWSGSPYLSDSGLLNPGILTKTQCGEYYHVAHNHDLTQVTNYGITFGGMLTLIKVEPAGVSCGE